MAIVSLSTRVLEVELNLGRLEDQEAALTAVSSPQPLTVILHVTLTFTHRHYNLKGSS